jgi:heat shock protein HtpX
MPAVHPHETFRDLVARNKRSSAVMIVAFCLFVPLMAASSVLLLITFFAGVWLRAVLQAHPQLTPTLLCLGIAALAAVFSAVYCLLMYQRGDEIILDSLQAERIHHDDDPELFNVVEEVAIAASIPKPHVFRINDPARNAMATGWDPKHATIVVTTGLRAALTREELQGVIAHEISHIRNYDTRLMLLTAVLVGAIAGLSDFCKRMFLQLVSADESNETSGLLTRVLFMGIILSGMWLGPLVMLVVLAALLGVMLLAPVSARLIQMGVARQREYLADASAVELTRYPGALADALWKIEHDRHDLQAVSGATAHLFISNPIKKFRRLAHTAFSSHPPLKERIRRLAMLAQG